MKITKIILFAVCTAFSTANFAQLSIGLRAGMNFSNYIVSPKMDNTNSSVKITEPGILGLNLAIPLEIKVSKKFAIQPEFVYIEKGFANKVQTSNTLSETKSVLNYLEIPVSAKILFGNSAGSIFNILVGPSIGFLVGGKSKSESSSKLGGGGSIQTNKTETTFDLRSDTYKDLAKTDFGVHFGVGADSPDAYKVFNRGFGLSFGYLHQLGGK